MTSLSIPQPAPAISEGVLLPFRYIFGRKANLAILIVVFVLLMVFVTLLLATLRGLDKTDQQRLEVLKIVGIASLVMGQIAFIIRIEVSEYKNHKSRHDLAGKVNAATMTVQAATKTVEKMAEKAEDGQVRVVVAAAEEARRAERDQMMNDPAFRKRMAEELCPMLSDDVVRRVLEGLRDGEGAERAVNRPPYPTMPK